jgi:amino acid adenylation domain-containing protein
MSAQDQSALTHSNAVVVDEGPEPGSADRLPAYPRDLSVHAVFRWYARRTPDAVALMQDGAVVTYGGLAERANRLARQLEHRGIVQGSVVGLLTSRSINSVVAWLATLKCGAVYLPLDPAYPPEHLAFVIGDAAPGVVLADEALIASGVRVPGFDVLSLEGELAASATASPAENDAAVDPMAPAYIMYTSGSTGRPKGVVVPHRAIVRLVRDQNYARFASDEVFLSLAPLAFDASTFEIWGALLNGAKLGIVGCTSPSLDAIAGAIRDYQVTTLWLTAGLFHVFVDCDLDGLRSLRQLLAGGDVLSPVRVKKAQAALPQCRLINGYGPTENTTFSCCYIVPREDWSGAVPIGRPIAHTDAYILDADMQPVADGDVGQLCVAGDGLSLGYLNRPELSAEKFVSVSIAGRPEERLYLTGDQVRRRPDGNIEFLGRNDRQVKIDGKRIELDEIELSLRRDARLADAVVVLRKLPSDIMRVAAFLKPASVPAPEDFAERLLADLRQKVPAHMVPHEVTVVEAFPLTSNGKVDRAALLELGTRTAPPPSAAAFGSDLEANIARIWSDVLKLSQIDPNANFFDLGGTSLQMVRIHAELRQRLASEINIVDLFAHPRVSDLARFLDGRSQAADASSAARMRAARQTAMLRNAQRIVRNRRS